MRIAGLTLADGLAKGSDGGAGNQRRGRRRGSRGFGRRDLPDAGRAHAGRRGLEREPRRRRRRAAKPARARRRGAAATVERGTWATGEAGQVADRRFFGAQGRRWRVGGRVAVEAGFSSGGSGGPGGGSAFGGGSGGNGGFMDSEGTSTRGTAGAGGSGLGGAIFARSGLLQLIDTTFSEQRGDRRRGWNGCVRRCGKGRRGIHLLYQRVRVRSGCGGDLVGEAAFRDNAATDAGGEQSLPGRDDRDVCGHLSSPVATHLSIVAPPHIEPGETFSVAVTALDASDNLVLTYAGKVHLASSDPEAVMPPDAELSNGRGVFSLTLKTVGKHMVTGRLRRRRR